MDSLSIVLCTCGLESRLRRLKALVHVTESPADQASLPPASAQPVLGHVTVSFNCPED